LGPKDIERARKARCEVCGSTWAVQVHHIKTRGSGGDDSPDNLIALCVECHSKAHSGQLTKQRLLEVKRRGMEAWNG